MHGSGVLTRDNIARVHVVLVLDEAKAIHELDLGNLAGAMGVEVVLNIGLGSYIHKIQLALPCPGFHACPAPILEDGALANPCQPVQKVKRACGTCMLRR